MHERDPRSPTELLIDQPPTRQLNDLDTYKGEVAARLQEVAQAQVKKAQMCQKTAYDR